LGDLFTEQRGGNMKNTYVRFSLIIAVLALFLAGLVTFGGCRDTKYRYIVGNTLGHVVSRGKLRVGVRSDTMEGFFNTSTETGLEADLAKAIAAAIFGDPTGRIEYVGVTAGDRFTRLQSGEFDVLIRVTTHTMDRDTLKGLNFAPVYFYDGQGILAEPGVTTLNDLNGQKIGLVAGSSSIDNLKFYMQARSIPFTDVTYVDTSAMIAGLKTGDVSAVSIDKSQLAVRKSTDPALASYNILSDTIEKEPLAPAVRHGDDQWLDIVSWCMYALFQAEELGITDASATAYTPPTTGPYSPMDQFFGANPAKPLGEWIGLDKDFALNIIKAVGNFDEIYTRHLDPAGTSSDLIPRATENKNWTQGGLLYSPPFR
jgi:general L-amino acid transport system substrate-binding protein